MLVDAIGVDGRQQASARAGGRSDRERRNGSVHAGQRGLARARPDSAKTVHRRWRESVVEGIRRTFGSAAAIQRQIHKARNITERLPKDHHAATCRVLRQAWELDAEKAEKLIRNLARRLDQQWPGVAATILEGPEEILTVVRLKLPTQLRRSLASIKIAENMMGTIRRVTRNVRRWRDAGVALRWAAAGMIEANTGFRQLKAHVNCRSGCGPSSFTTIARQSSPLPTSRAPRNIHSGNVGPT
ncbi:hypothetical protein ABIB00_007621 [Bradyrhizobium sp. LB14.3]